LANAVASTTDPAQLSRIRSGPHLFFINTTFDDRNSRVVIAALDTSDPLRYVTPLACTRMYFSGSRGLCLYAQRGVLTRYYAAVFDAGLRELGQLPLKGTPSRARVSPDGRFGATTVFVNGDSYSAGSFSTRTTILDMENVKAIADLEELAVFRDGRPFRRADFNFWGVTFGTDNVFYATLATGGEMLLVRGTVSGRELRVVHEGVECPSLSPDGTRIGYKKRDTAGGHLTWSLRVLNLKTGAETPVAETRSVDDQIAWLDNQHILYSLPAPSSAPGGADIWATRADGGGTPAMFRPQGYSPSVIY
jgi:hypothetical protein